MDQVRLVRILSNIYSQKDARWLAGELVALTESFQCPTPDRSRQRGRQSLHDRVWNKASQSDIALITYANTIEDVRGTQVPLATLQEVLTTYKINQFLPIVHILPFYPWDIDRGFSVTDYQQVHAEYGTWEDIAALSQTTTLMFDFVANHASIDNPLVQSALIERHLPTNDSRYRKVEPYKDFVIAYSDEDKPTNEDLATLARPRANPVLTRYTVFETTEGEMRAILGEPHKEARRLGRGFVWCTFSRPTRDDGSEKTRQVDLNYANPKVLLEVVKTLLLYIQRGAELIRLDAIGYIWKKLGSTSLHEPQVHTLLEAIDYVLSEAAPGVRTVAEVNEPQHTLLPYLGTAGHPEADLVYQFTHFPLAVHAVLTGDATYYTRWLPTTHAFNGRQFITVLGSHDGMGLKPIRDILPEKEIEKMTNVLANKFHALQNYANLPGGKQIVYEMCATPWNLVNQPDSKEDHDTQLNRYLAVLALGLIPRGIPALYINGVFGAENYLPREGLDENRTINREIFDKTQLAEQLDAPRSHMRMVLDAVRSLIKKRAQEPAFSPSAPPLEILDPRNEAIVAVRVPAPEEHDSIMALVNVSDIAQKITIEHNQPSLHDVLSGKTVTTDASGALSLTLTPYEVLWLKQQ